MSLIQWMLWIVCYLMSSNYLSPCHGQEPEVSVVDGEVTIKNANNCTIYNNGAEYTVSNEDNVKVITLETPLFGLISWKCNNIYKGETISFFTCGSCGVYCVYNQYITQCQSNTLPIILGLVTSTSIFLLLTVLSLTVFKHRLNVLYAKVIVYFLMRSDRRRVNRIIRYNKATGQNIEVKLKNITYNNYIIDALIIRNRLKLIKQMTHAEEEPIYSEIIYNRSADYRRVNDMLKRSENRAMILQELNTNKQYIKRRASNISNTVVAGLAVMSTLPQNTYGCNQMLYIKSNGRICYSGKCYDLSTYSLSLSDGETACFNDLDNNRLSIKLESIYNVARFSSLYDTSSYTINNTGHWNCLGSGKCWHGIECGNGYKLNLLDKTTKEPHGYGCHMTSVSCYGAMCVHGTSCVWYRWQINPIGPIIPVYTFISEIWEVKLTIRYKEIIKTITLNTNNPKYDINDILSEVMNHMPFYIGAVNYEKRHLRDSIVKINDTYFNVNAAPHNMPQRGIIGDIQIDKHNKKILFYDNNIDCSVDACTIICLANEPAINRLISTSPYRVDIEHIELLKMYNEGWINYRYRSSGHCTITFGNVELKELVVEKPHCTIKVGLSYACEACTEQPRATIISSNVQTEGMLSYESNCTWDRASLSCNREMYDLVQISKHKYCNIYLPLLNQTLDIIFNYEYRGELSNMKTIRAETTMDIFSDLVTNSSFITTLLTSFSSFLLFTGIGTMAIKMTRLGVLAIGRKEIQKA